MMSKDMITTKELAAMLGVHCRTIRKWIINGTCPKPIRINARVHRFKRDEISAWMEKRRDAS